MGGWAGGAEEQRAWRGWAWELLIWTHSSSMKAGALVQGPRSAFSGCIKIVSGKGRAASLSAFVGHGSVGIITGLVPVVLGRG